LSVQILTGDKKEAICHGDGIHGHADCATPIPRTFSANSAGVARRGDQRATKQASDVKRHAARRNYHRQHQRIQIPPLYKAEKIPAATNARSAPTPRALVADDGKKRNRVRFRLSLAAPLRRTASLMPFRRPPAAFRRQRQTEADYWQLDSVKK
jgi:hypothetical protein